MYPTGVIVLSCTYNKYEKLQKLVSFTIWLDSHIDRATALGLRGPGFKALKIFYVKLIHNAARISLKISIVTVWECRRLELGVPSLNLSGLLLSLWLNKPIANRHFPSALQWWKQELSWQVRWKNVMCNSDRNLKIEWKYTADVSVNSNLFDVSKRIWTKVTVTATILPIPLQLRKIYLFVKASFLFNNIVSRIWKLCGLNKVGRLKNEFISKLSTTHYLNDAMNNKTSETII